MAVSIPFQEIQEEVTAHEGVMDSVKLLSYKLQQEVGGSCHVNPAAIHSRLESMSRRWDHLLKLSQERYIIHMYRGSVRDECVSPCVQFQAFCFRGVAD